MSEAAFWKFVWLAGVRLPFVIMPARQAIAWSIWGCSVLIIARYTGFNAARAWDPSKSTD